ncbi:hypothetical protein C1H46_044837 [Malus baccata]|uniref:Pentatricopeptide repeat-containing protein-mitochondrial domain-containing protein n=1 Tax=Malus baccata TaxID=106549 RepID=A0A540K5Y3_MALBA|nr:hypothetical protein C1H46_044837 [Malus baccata]
MRHGRPFLVKDHRHHGASQLGDILLVAAITNTLSTSGTRILPDLCNFPLSEPLLLQILRAQSLHPSKKLDFFKWCSLTHNIKHSARTFYHILRTASRPGFLHEAPQLLHSMKEDVVVVDSQTFKALLDAFIRSGKFDYALDILDIMEDVGAGLNTDMYNSVLVALLGKNQYGLAMAILLKLLEGGDSSQKKGQFVDGVTYSIVVLQLCKDGLLEEALGLVEEMEGRGFTVDSITVSSLVIGLYKEGRWDWTGKLMKHIRDGNLVPSVLKWKVDMEASLKNPQRNRKDYTPLFPSKGDLSEIMSLIKSAPRTMLKDAYKFLKIMLGAGCTPNHVTDTTLDFLGKEIEKMRYQKASMVRDKDD